MKTQSSRSLRVSGQAQQGFKSDGASESFETEEFEDDKGQDSLEFDNVIL